MITPSGSWPLRGQANSPEMEFLDINLTKDLSLLLHDIHSPFLWLIVKENLILLWFKNPYKKICETRKLKSIHEKYFVQRENDGRKPDKNCNLRRLEFMPRKLD